MNIPDEIRKLADLKAAGHITDEEFQDAKRRLLAPQVVPPTLPIYNPPERSTAQRSAFRGPPHECWNCGGPLRKGADAKNSGSGCLIIILGLCLAPVIIGIPIILYGLHLGGKKEAFWQCKKCDSKFPRQIRWYEFG